MKNKIPVKSLSQMNYVMTVTISSTIAIFLYTFSVINSQAIYTVVHSSINILAVSFFHILVLVQLNRYGSKLATAKRRFYDYFFTYIFTVVYSFCVTPLRSLFENETWKTITFSQQVITVIVGSIIMNILIISMHSLVMNYQKRNAIEHENAELKLANAEANNLLLKQQIHPHFLFNALNILKTLYKKDAAAGDIYIVHLANFLRAAISTTSAKLVSIGDEIKLCNDYISMQKIRFGTALQYTINIPATQCKEGFIPSFSLQPLLENAIKHNDATSEHPLNIKVFIDNGNIVVENNLQRKKHPVSSTGSGLMNLIKRYQLISGDEVIIQENSIIFSVRLKILGA